MSSAASAALHHRIGLRLRRDQRVLERPGRLLQLERAGLADAGLPRIGEAAAVQHLRDQPGRIEAAQRGLRVGGVGQAHGADAPVAPGLVAQPGAGIEPVLAVGQVFDEAALRAVPAAGVLVDDGIAMRGEIARRVRAREAGVRSAAVISLRLVTSRPYGVRSMMTGNGPAPSGRCTSVARRTPSRIATISVTVIRLPAAHANFLMDAPVLPVRC